MLAENNSLDKTRKFILGVLSSEKFSVAGKFSIGGHVVFIRCQEPVEPLVLRTEGL